MAKRFRHCMLFFLLVLLFVLPSQALAYSGTCGENLTWDLTLDGTLTISGTGEMTSNPWRTRLVKNVIIQEGVTCIDVRAFFENTDLISVSIPDSVTAIGDWAFYNCINLVSVDLPDHLVTIGEWAFNYCIKLSDITIPDGVTTIGRDAFDGCKGATTLTIPDSVISIGDNAFYGCKGLTSVHIPDGVSSIGKNAFGDCTALSTVSLPDSLTSVGSLAFKGCNNIRIVMPGSARPVWTLDQDVATFTICCYRGTGVDLWARENSYRIIYLDDLSGPVAMTLRADNPVMEKGETQTLQVSSMPETAAPSIVWSSSDPTVASVADGVVTALSSGTVTITAACGNASASTELMVCTKLESFSLPAREFWYVYRESGDIPVTCSPADADTHFIITNYDAMCFEPRVNGSTITIRALEPGFASSFTLTDTLSGLCQTYKVHVFFPVDEIAFDPAVVSIPCMGSRQLCAVVNAAHQSAVNQLVTFASSDERVAVVDRKGFVAGITPGTAVITATAANGVSASCTVTVREPVAIALPADLQHLEAEALMGTAAEMYILPQGMKTIGARAFADCTRMVCIDIPDSVTAIADDAFASCDALTIIAPRGSHAHTFALANHIRWLEKIGP